LYKQKEITLLYSLACVNMSKNDINDATIKRCKNDEWRI